MKRVPQAERAKQAASANIEVKLGVLKAWLKNGIPYVEDEEGHTLLEKNGQRIIDFYPRSLRQFKEWDGSQNCSAVRSSLPTIGRIGNDTLANRPEFEKIAIDLIESLKRVAQQQSDSSRQSVILKLSDQVAVLEQLLKIRRTEFRLTRQSLLACERKYEELKNQFERETNQLRSTFFEQQSEIAQLKATNSDLTASLSKLVPIGAVRRDEE